MRYSLFAFFLLMLAHKSFAQPKTKPSFTSMSGVNHPKTIRGARVTGVSGISVSPEGGTVAISYDPIIVIDIQKGIIREMPKKWRDISVDNSYCYGNWGYYPDTRPGKPADTKTYGMRVAGVFTDTTEQTVFFSDNVFGADVVVQVDGQARRILATDVLSYGWQTGMHLFDLKTGALVQSLRRDSFRTEFEAAIIQKNYVVYRGSYSHLIIPLDTGKLVTLRTEGFLESGLADDNHIYTHPRQKDNDLIAFNRRTGEKAAVQSFPDAFKGQMFYSVFNNRIYRYDQATATVYEEEVRNNSFATIASYKTEGFSLPKNQRWSMVACKGPSLLFIPLDIESAETNGEAANTATLISLPSGKPSLKISPFFVRTADDYAQQVADKKAADERWTKAVAEEERRNKETAAKKAAECKKNWGNDQFNRGITRMWGEFYVILESYDCEKDEYRFWLPNQAAWSSEGKYAKDNGSNFRAVGNKPTKQYYKCNICDGDGSYEVTVHTTKTKELPWGYFSGIETKSIRTTSTTRKQFCNSCSGQGIVLK
jgi:hypothetical protein